MPAEAALRVRLGPGAAGIALAVGLGQPLERVVLVGDGFAAEHIGLRLNLPVILRRRVVVAVVDIRAGSEFGQFQIGIVGAGFGKGIGLELQQLIGRSVGDVAHQSSIGAIGHVGQAFHRIVRIAVGGTARPGPVAVALGIGVATAPNLRELSEFGSCGDRPGPPFGLDRIRGKSRRAPIGLVVVAGILLRCAVVNSAVEPVADFTIGREKLYRLANKPSSNQPSNLAPKLRNNRLD